jgi:hypothetical protein
MARVNRNKVDGFPNPVIPEVSIELDGEVYKLCFDFQALAIAKAKLKEAGVEINVLRSINFADLDVDTLPAVFFAAASRCQPGLTWEQAQRTVNIRTAGSIAVGLFAAWKAAMAKPAKNPPVADKES